MINFYIDLRIYSYHTLGGCPFGQDEMWNITWPATNASTTARQKCPGNSESQGTNELVVQQKLYT